MKCNNVTQITHVYKEKRAYFLMGIYALIELKGGNESWN